MSFRLRDIILTAAGRPPGQLVIQFTDKCNAHCPQCGMRVANRFQRTTLSDGQVRRILDSAARRGFAAVSFTGGEPFLETDRLISHLEHAGRAGVRYLRTGTNGFIFGRGRKADRIKSLADRLAATRLRNLWISLDSADPAVHEQMRGLPGVVEGITEALPIFHQRHIYPSANLGINRNTGGRGTVPARPRDPGSPAYLDEFQDAFYTAFLSFFDQAASLGFTMVNACYPMSLEAEGAEGLSAVYAAESADEAVIFTRGEKARIFKALMQAASERRSRLRIFSPLVSLDALAKDYNGAGKYASYPCRGGRDFWFVDARSGHTWPCGYRGGEDHGPFPGLDRAAVRKGPDCRACDWECFRDPSELMGPVAEAFADTRGLLRKISLDPGRFRYWLEDLRYYRACDFFDGRRPPDYKRLAAFRPPAS